ncbi:type IV toxin-antitoxin system AbiEi family antitoxin domain-containing protein [Rhodococcus sp. UNC23MFCrub1.1]|uniref:type IV toxin-antitoxin system AbiEi family antitoxin domain-containing protein n=1 Tax=Rhodococcus sp. UNC23MFCrub1.1 TaxID=1449068 RepID=UPI000561A6FB|nr:type IV toxin-antitoxin system AbiEi family antitoxin domain-containing protein [Rhodococcus sp. UNC23MFCrub1.1]
MADDPLITRRDLVHRGVSDSEIRRALRSGSISSVRRGCFVGSRVMADLSAEARHLLSARAVLSAGGSDLVLSHESAAVHWGLPLIGGPPHKVHVTATSGRRGRVDADRYLHSHSLGPVDLTTHDQTCVTTLARTVVDLACSLSFEAAVCAGDAASADDADIRAALQRCGRRAGIARARRVADFIDRASESVGESRSRVYLDRHGLPRPRLQVEIVVDGRVYRPDFLWDNVIGEFDGMVKYTGGGEATETVMIAEKLREDALRAAGWIVVRWTWADLVDGRLAQRIRAALSA